jgi:isoleucyl-tRNA synthetase
MPQLSAAIAALDAAHVAQALRDGRAIGVSIDGREHQLRPEELQLALQPPEGYEVEREGAHAVALELSVDEELRLEGLAREVVHAVQRARKDTGLAVEQRIALRLGGDGELLRAARAHERYVTGETLATSIAYDLDGAGEPATIEGRELRIALERAA